MTEKCNWWVLGDYEKDPAYIPHAYAQRNTELIKHYLPDFRLVRFISTEHVANFYQILISTLNKAGNCVRAINDDNSLDNISIWHVPRTPFYFYVADGWDFCELGMTLECFDHMGLPDMELRNEA